tara:strand:+ start:828 stop:1610 length:783 start_codon:yes stop_codon:yes gene_type:complete
MLTVLLALLPAIAVTTWFAGTDWALRLLAMGSLALVLEALALRLRGRGVALKHQDGSVLVTAMLLLLMLPTALPWWQSAAGVAIAVIVGKHIFGGLGQNLFNPVAVGYLGLMTLVPGSLTAPTSVLTADTQPWVASVMILATLSGGLILLHRRIIGWHVPLSMLLTTTLLFTGFDLALNASIMVLVALFIATDPVTSPGTRTGRLVYGCLIAAVSAVMAHWLSYPASAAAAIVCGNAITPALDQLIRHDRSMRLPREDRQ